MIKEVFRCNKCKRVFDVPNFYYEKHRLDTPPYEMVAICPKCNSSEFVSFDSAIEKIEVVERLLISIAAFNRYFDNLKNVFGTLSENKDFSEGYEILTEFIDEMFPFITVNTEKNIFKIKTQNDVERVLLQLIG